METESTCDGKAVETIMEDDLLGSCGSVQVAPRPVKVAAEVTMEDGSLKRLWKRPSASSFRLSST
jgi:hypothetical protein